MHKRVLNYKISRLLVKCVLIPTTNLKHTKPTFKLQPISLDSFLDNENICVVSCAKAYLRIRTNIAKGIGPLIITHRKPYRPASSDTIFHWIKDIMVELGIDTDIFTANSCRAAATSKAKAKGLTLFAGHTGG